jgi:GT2 family glycosyltransferase
MTPLATVSVILPTSNRCDVARTTIERLLAQNYPAEQLEILVADNSSDDTAAMVTALARDSAVPVRLLSSDERLPAIRRNHALRAADGDLVLFLNDDVWVGPDFVSTHVAAHAQFAEPVAVLGRVEQTRQVVAMPFVGRHRPFAYSDIADRAGQPVPWHYSWSMNLSLPRHVMLDHNLIFHEDWTETGHEDVELGYRWCKAGYQIIYVPAARGEHHHRHDLAGGRRLQASIGRGLRELEALVPEPGLHERYGVLSADASMRQRLRKTARRALFNAVTAPPLEQVLQRLPRSSRVAEWCSWELSLRHTQLGYAESSPRQPRRTQTRPEPARA